MILTRVMVCALLSAAPALMTAQHVESNGAGVRSFALSVGRSCVLEVGNRFVSPVWLVVEGRPEIADGFSEALNHAGIAPRIGPADQSSGTQITLRELRTDGRSESELSVRVERLPDRMIVYSRVFSQSTVQGARGTSGLLDEIVVPVIVAATAVVLVYLLFTVRK